MEAQKVEYFVKIRLSDNKIWANNHNSASDNQMLRNQEFCVFPFRQAEGENNISCYIKNLQKKFS